MPLVLVTPPASEPVSLAEAKAHLRVDHTDDEALIAALVTAARDLVESSTGRVLVTQTWRLDLAGFPAGAGEIELPKPPCASVTSVAYTDPSGASQTLAGSDWTLVSDTGPRAAAARLMPTSGTVWPVTQDIANAVRITFVAGYGAASAVPKSLNAVLLLLLGDLYASREAQTMQAALNANPTVDRLLGPYRVIWTG